MVFLTDSSKAFRVLSCFSVDTGGTILHIEIPPDGSFYELINLLLEGEAESDGLSRSELELEEFVLRLIRGEKRRTD